MSQPWLVVGLGNPGPEYARTRHNVGQMVLDELASRLGGAFRVHKARAQVLETRLRPGGPRVVLAKPMTYMNASGGPVAGLARFYDIPAERVIAVHDEIDIPFAALKLKLGGGEGGHNGLRDMSKALSTKDYHRLRVGVGRPPGRMDAASYVLKAFSATEAKELPLLLDDAADAVETVIDHGLLEAQQKYHAHRRVPLRSGRPPAEEGRGLRWAMLGVGVLAVDALVMAVPRARVLAARVGPEGTWPSPVEITWGWAGTGDGSLVELWGQLQLVAAAVLLLCLTLQAPGRRVLAACAAVLLTMAADDRLRLHERAGRLLDLEEVVPDLTRRGAQEMGGLVYWAVVGTVLIAGLLRTYVTSVPVARRAARILLGSVVPLVVVAVLYVVLSALGGDLLYGLTGIIVVDVRTTVKLLTATACLVLAMRWRESLS